MMKSPRISTAVSLSRLIEGNHVIRVARALYSFFSSHINIAPIVPCCTSCSSRKVLIEHLFSNMKTGVLWIIAAAAGHFSGVAMWCFVKGRNPNDHFDVDARSDRYVNWFVCSGAIYHQRLMYGSMGLLPFTILLGVKNFTGHTLHDLHLWTPQQGHVHDWCIQCVSRLEGNMCCLTFALAPHNSVFRGWIFSYVLSFLSFLSSDMFCILK